ncbi:MAG TPA: MFS transporter, partial [Anaerolineales bacterium]|nr:MFS transporter [Anaerolineales bacterium]
MITEPRVSKKFLSPALSGSLYYLFTFLGAGAYNPFVYVYFTDLGLSGKQVGFLSILGPVMTMLFSTAIASLADRRHSRRRFAQVALSGCAIIVFFLRFPTSFNGIALLMVIYAIFFSPLMGLADGLIARAAQRFNLNYGGMRLWGSF